MTQGRVSDKICIFGLNMLLNEDVYCTLTCKFNFFSFLVTPLDIFINIS